MPLYRFRMVGGEEYRAEAHRLRMDELSVYAENCRMGASPPWVVVLRLSLAEIVDVRRRLELSGGDHGWLDPPADPEHLAVDLVALAEGLAYYVLIGLTAPDTARARVLGAVSALYP